MGVPARAPPGLSVHSPGLRSGAISHPCCPLFTLPDHLISICTSIWPLGVDLWVLKAHMWCKPGVWLLFSLKYAYSQRCERLIHTDQCTLRSLVLGKRPQQWPWWGLSPAGKVISGWPRCLVHLTRLSDLPGAVHRLSLLRTVSAVGGRYTCRGGRITHLSCNNRSLVHHKCIWILLIWS